MAVCSAAFGREEIRILLNTFINEARHFMNDGIFRRKFLLKKGIKNEN
jgi:hypothetical protein